MAKKTPFEIDELQLIKGEPIKINDHIYIKNPTLDDIAYIGEQKYYSIINSLTVNPTSMKAVLFYEMNIDYTKISDFSLFIMMLQTYQSINKEAFKKIIDGFFFEDMYIDKNQNDDFVLRHKDGWVIDEIIYKKIVDALRSVHHLEEKIELPGNEHTKKYLIERDKRRMERQKREKFKPYLSHLIKALVNCSNFKYDFDTVFKLNVYAFFESINAINKLQNYNFVMSGAYSGMVQIKESTLQQAYWLARD